MFITASDLVRQSIHFYFSHFKVIFKYLFFVICTWLLLFLNSALGFNTSTFSSVAGQRVSLIISLVIQIILLITSYIVLLAFKRGMAHIIRGTVPTSIFRELLNTRKIFWKAIGVSVLYGLIVLGGSILLAIPGIIFGFWFYFSRLGVILDNQTPVEALKASKQLVAGRFGAVVWRLCAPTMFYVIVFSSISWAIITPGQYYLASTGSVTIFLLTTILGSIFNFLVIPITTLTPILLYEHLKQAPKAQ